MTEPTHVCPECHTRYFAGGKCDWDGLTLWKLENNAAKRIIWKLDVPESIAEE